MADGETVVLFKGQPPETAPDPHSVFQAQGYRFIGDQAAVKTCHWTRNALGGGEPCYKQKFYGIRSHRCVQMTPVIACNHRCMHCWRPIDVKFPEIRWDDPADVALRSVEEQRRVLTGFGGNPNTPEEMFEEAMSPAHVAISLDGEPTLYPRLPELIEEYHRLNMTTFVVTNGSRPDVVRTIRPTQLYLSMNAPDPETYRLEVNPHGDTWPQFLETLDVFREHPSRTVVRITLVQGVNDHSPEKYAALLRRARPWFVEVKSYMHVGYSRLRLERVNMSPMEHVRGFARAIEDHLAPDYRVEDESEVSRVVMLMRRGVERFLRFPVSDSNSAPLGVR